MAKRKCFNCGKELGFWSQRFDLKDGSLCGDCWSKYGFANHADMAAMSQYLETLSIKQCKELIDNPDKMEKAKINHGFTKHFWESEQAAREKEKNKIEKGKIVDKKARENAEKQAALNKKYETLLPAFEKEASAVFGKYIFDDTRRAILRKKSFLFDPAFIKYSDIISYRVNQQGHNETKKHGITRAIVGGAIAGGVGSIVGATTGGKQTDYIDHLGVIINLKDGSDFEIVFIRKIEEIKSNSFSARESFREANNLISILNAIIADNQNATQSNGGTSTTSDNADEIRKYKKLADDGIITEDEFNAKKKQLLGL